jgi:hypothetical protein
VRERETVKRDKVNRERASEKRDRGGEKEIIVPDYMKSVS